MNENDTQFYPQLVKRDGLWYFWVKIKGDPVDAAYWQFVARIESQGKGIFMEVKEQVQPADFSVRKIIETGDRNASKMDENILINSRWVPEAARGRTNDDLGSHN